MSTVDGNSSQMSNLRRRRKRWKVPDWASIIVVAVVFLAVVEAHVPSDGAKNVKFLRSETSQLKESSHLTLASRNAVASTSTEDIDQDLSLSTQSGLRDISLDDISLDDISRDDVSNVTPLNGSSRTLKSLQSTFERHFRETLLCDSNNIIFNSGSGSIVLETIVLEGCNNLTSINDIFNVDSEDDIFNLSVETFRDELKNLTVTKSPSLKHLLGAFGFRFLRQLNLRNNGIVSLELEAILPNLEDLDLSGNPVTRFVPYDVTRKTPLLKKLVLTNCSNLESIEFSSLGAKKTSGLLVTLETLILDDNPNLVRVCPWFIRSAPNLKYVSFNRCPKLEVLPGIFTDHRFFPILEKIDFSETSVSCDCSLHLQNATHINVVLAEIFRRELHRQKTCRYNSTTMPVDHFFGSSELCQAENELIISDINPTLTLSSFDPYADVDFNSTDVNTTNIFESIFGVDEEEEVVNENNETRVYVWNTVQLDCQLDKEAETIFWVTPTNAVFLLKNNTSDQESCQPTVQILENACGQVSTFDNEASNVRIFDNGTLLISDFGYADRGNYECFVSTGKNRAGFAKLKLGLDHTYRNGIYNLSLIYGFAVCGAFLLITLLFKLIHFLLHNYGCCLFCCCCENKLPPKARRLKRAMDSIEAYRTQQLEKLRENYTQQSDWIRDNCASQMERVRDNYNSQIQNLKDIRQYGSSQLSAVRGQYYEQMSRIRDYSANHLDRVHENYIFQRQRLRKFSAQNYLKVQETGVYTRKTLTKVMENIPVLYLDLTTCRQGLGDRQPSIEWVDPDQFLELDPYPSHRSMLHREQSEHRSESIYFTPTGTPVREIFGSWAAGVQSNSLKNTPTKEIDPYKAVYLPGRRPGHRRNRSFSQFLPPLPTWLSSSTSASVLSPNGRPPREMRINEVEVVIEHETNSSDYYIDTADVSPTTTTTLSKVVSGSLRRSTSMPSDEASGGKRSLTSSSGVLSMESSNSPNQQTSTIKEEEGPLLQRNEMTKSVLYLFPTEEEASKKKRLSV